ncbi:MAG: archaemetzincin family Zn-dependent metalloprotease [Thermoleophilia bacterium]
MPNRQLQIRCFQGTTDVDPATLVDALAGVFGIHATAGPTLAVPGNGLDARRHQYRTEAFLDALVREVNGGTGTGDAAPVLVGLTEADLFVPRLSFVFGQADPVRGVAVVSTHRLRAEFYGGEPDPGLFRERLLKESIHELGHVFGLTHCDDAACIMHFSNAIADSDRKGPGFCRRCQGRLDESGAGSGS